MFSAGHVMLRRAVRRRAEIAHEVYATPRDSVTAAERCRAQSSRRLCRTYGAQIIHANVYPGLPPWARCVSRLRRWLSGGVTGNLRRIGRGGNWSGRCDSRRRGFRGRSASRLVASRSLATRSQMRRRLRRCRWHGGGCGLRSRAGRVLSVRGRVRWLRSRRDGLGRTRISRRRRSWN